MESALNIFQIEKNFYLHSKVEVDSTQAATIDLPSVGNTSEPIATVSIPANSFVNADGEPYEVC